MMMLVNKYGLSHVCAKKELEETGLNIFPYLDVSSQLAECTHFDPDTKTCYGYIPQMKFYFRGALDRNSPLKNLFEYLLLKSWNR